MSSKEHGADEPKTIPAATGYGPPSGIPLIPRLPVGTAELTSVRHNEIAMLSERLGRVGRFALASVWTTLATLTWGVALGGSLALIPFLSTSPQPSFKARLVYFIALSVAFLLGVVFTGAAWTTHKERSDSIDAIKADFDKHILGTFEMPQTIERVVSAVYGLLDDQDESKRQDVTHTVASMLTRGRLVFTVSNETLGCDPAPLEGKMFALEFKLSGSGREARRRFPEHSYVDLP